MRFLLDANMPRAAQDLLLDQSHDALHVGDVGLRNAPDQHIDSYARTKGRALVTRDLTFADVRRYPPAHTPGYLVMRVPDTWIATDIAALLRRFLAADGLIEHLPGHLVILDPRQVRFRPALEHKSF